MATFTRSVDVYSLFANQIKCQNVTRKLRSKWRRRKTGILLFDLFFASEFLVTAYSECTNTQYLTDILTYTAQETGDGRWGKICISVQQTPKNEKIEHTSALVTGTRACRLNSYRSETIFGRVSPLYFIEFYAQRGAQRRRKGNYLCAVFDHCRAQSSFSVDGLFDRRIDLRL